MTSFKDRHAFEHRLKETTSIMSKYPDRLPVICEQNKRDKNSPHISRCKYLVPNNLTIGELLFIIRKYIKINNAQAIFLFINGAVPPTSETINQIYEHNKDKDGFLYMTISLENTFG